MTMFQNMFFRLSNFTSIPNCRYQLLNRVSTSVVPQYSRKQTVEEKLGIKPRPKRPPTPFLKYLNLNRARVIEKNPQAQAKDVVRLLSEEWKNTTDSVKNKLQEEYKTEWSKYLEDCKEYEKTLSPFDREEIAKAKEDVKIVKEKKAMKKMKEDLGCPKRPGSSYMYFMKSKLPERGDMPFQEFQNNVKSEWGKLPALEKDRFEELYKKDMEDYRAKMLLWKKEMDAKGVVINQPKSLESKVKHEGIKKPASSYIYFMKSRLLQRGDTPFREFQKMLKEEWEKMPEKEKKKYDDMYQKDYEEYKLKMADWSKTHKTKTTVGVRSP